MGELNCSPKENHGPFHPEEVMGNNHAHLKSSIITACMQGKEKKSMDACTKKGYHVIQVLTNYHD